MRIEEDLKLGFKDVLIRPKRSTLKSRSDVQLEREFTFKHSGQTWSGVPIIAANMDTVGTFAMAKALASFGVLTAVHSITALNSGRRLFRAYRQMSCSTSWSLPAPPMRILKKQNRF